MKQFIIFPTHQTEGMYGYSAIAIEVTNDNILALQHSIHSLTKVREINDKITSICYETPSVEIKLFNDEFETQIDSVHLFELNEDQVNKFQIKGYCSVLSPILTVSTYQIKIEFEAKFSNSKVYCEFNQEDLNFNYNKLGY